MARKIGAVSPTYHNILEVSERIQQYIPEAKLVVILQKPVEQAYSEYLARVMDSGLPFTGFTKQPTKVFRADQDYNQPEHRYIHRDFYHTNPKRDLSA